MLQRNADSSEGLPLCSRGIITPSFYYQQLAADVHSLLQVRFKFSFVLDLHQADDHSQPGWPDGLNKMSPNAKKKVAQNRRLSFYLFLWLKMHILGPFWRKSCPIFFQNTLKNIFFWKFTALKIIL